LAYEIRTDYQTAKAVEWYRAQYSSSLRAKIANWGEQRAFAKLLQQVSPDQSILDIACGTGRFTAILLDHGHRVTGSDVSTEMLKVAGEQLGGHPGLLALHEGDAERLPFDAHSFDGIVCMRLYQRVPSQARVQMLKEVRRVGKGWAILFFGMSSPWLDVRRSLRNKLARRPNERYPITGEQLNRELQEAGLRHAAQAWAIPLVAEGLLVLVEW
jgi:ubiquinone/menaquinone biosynthesis C-methylase UbiE